MNFLTLTKKLDDFLEIGIPFYDCIVMKDGKCVYRHANGYTDINKKTEVTGKELYNLNSHRNYPIHSSVSRAIKE